MTVAIYARVSTDKQDLDQQIASCQRLCEAKGLAVGGVYADVMSGTKDSRPEFNKMLVALRLYELDAVVTFRLDRLGRKLTNLVLLLEQWENSGIKLYSVSESFDTSTALGRGMMHLIIVFAQMERDNISEATKQRLQALKANGIKLGRRVSASQWQIQRVRELHDQGMSVRRIATNSPLSYGTVYSVVKQRGAYSDNGNGS